jgi:hypothetical protein
MSGIGDVPRTAVPVSSARAEASRRNGAKSRGPKTPEGKARSAQNALQHGMRAEKHLVLPDEDGAEFAALEAAMVEELAPVGALQYVLARRVAVAAWRLARADRIEMELFEERRTTSGGLGLALLGRRVGERGPNPVPAAKRRQRRALVRDGWREPAPTLVVGALRPAAIAARRWPSSGARSGRSRRSKPGLSLR